MSIGRALVQIVRKIFFFSPVDLYLLHGRSPKPIRRSRKFIRMKTHAKAAAEEDKKVAPQIGACCIRSKVAIYWCGVEVWGGRIVASPCNWKNGNAVLAMRRHKHMRKIVHLIVVYFGEIIQFIRLNRMGRLWRWRVGAEEKFIGPRINIQFAWCFAQRMDGPMLGDACIPMFQFVRGSWLQLTNAHSDRRTMLLKRSDYRYTCKHYLFRLVVDRHGLQIASQPQWAEWNLICDVTN